VITPSYEGGREKLPATRKRSLSPTLSGKGEKGKGEREKGGDIYVSLVRGRTSS